MSLSGRRLAGSVRSISERKSDFYPTPTFATEALLEYVSFSGSILEPCCGKGHISKVLCRLENNAVVSYDIVDRGYGAVKNFFDEEDGTYSNVITNPPYRNAQKFVEKAKRVAQSKIAMFMKLVFLEGQERYSFFKDETFPLSEIFVFSERVTLALDGELESGGTIAYAWFVWNKNYIVGSRPTINWIAPRRLKNGTR